MKQASKAAIIELYCTSNCPYCKLTREFFEQRGITYHEFRVQFNQLSWYEMEARSQKSTVPQIFINGYHIGGYDELLTLNESHKLEKLI